VQFLKETLTNKISPMKKLLFFSVVFVMVINVAGAAQVESSVAKQVAENCIRKNARMKELNLNLTYTEKSKAGQADYYVFNVNSGIGFVIVSAEDAGYPIIGYSTEGAFEVPSESYNPEFNFWMQKRKVEIEYMRDHNVQATAEIKNEWNGYTSNFKTALPAINTVSVAPLCATKWNQNGGGSVPYNNLCPGGSVTGCVATAMAQIMKKWNYPAQGTGQSSYTAGTYGTLSANYGTTTYKWANMPNTSSNSDVATISYHCGVSVQMNYSPSGSGAMVCGSNPSAEYSYKTYFKYDPTIHCVTQSSDANWVADLETELVAGRPVQYQGVDASQGGHTWVCDGNDLSNNMHMNWGWGGSSDGYYAVTNLAPTGSGLNFTTQLGGLLGIKPLITVSVDAGVASVVTPNSTTCNTTFTPVVKLQNFGSVALTTCTILYHVDAQANQSYTWNGSLASGASTNVTLNSLSTTAGTHTFTGTTSNPNSSTDGNTTNDQMQSTFNISTSVASLPLMEGFESSASLPSGWTIYNPNSDGAWTVSSTVGHTGTHSIVFDNCTPSVDITGEKDRFMTSAYNFSLATSAQISFDVAYANLLLNNVTYSDTLAVFSSIDCGTTWNQIYLHGGSALATAPQLTAAAPTCFTPTSTQWRTENVALNNLSGQSSVMFAFENRSGWAENLYIDNINITAVTGIASVDPQNGFTIYPNPATSSVTIEGTSKSEKIHYSICNMLGAEIRSGDIPANGNTYSGKINVSDISNGMYFIKVVDGDSFITKKLNKQ